MPIELTTNGVDSSYLGSIWFKEKKEREKIIRPKKEPFFHYFYNKKIELRFLDMSQ